MNLGAKAILVQALLVAESQVSYQERRLKEAESLKSLALEGLSNAHQRAEDLRRALEEYK